jgi:hypothetical protein
MSNYDYEEEDSDLSDLGNDLVKQLRKANKQKDKELADLKSQFENLSKSQRERVIKDALERRGVNQKIASFIPQDIDPTEESVSNWLSNYADVFGLEVSQNQATPNVNPAQAQQYQRMTQAVDQAQTAAPLDDVYRRLMNANTREDLDAIIRESGI